MNQLCRCTKCKEIFSEDELITDYVNGGDIGEPHNECPHCGCDDIEYIHECTYCGKYFSDDDARSLHGYDGTLICEDCLKDEMDVRTIIEYGNTENNVVETHINGLFAYMFSESELNDILLAEFMRLPESKQKQYAEKYAECDLDDFAEWLVEDK